MHLLIEQPRRFLDEKSRMEELGNQVSWLLAYEWSLTESPAYDVCVNATLDIHGTQKRVRLIYPPLFPDAPAYIKPLDADARWSQHQYGTTGAFCLEYGPDNWNFSITGADLLASCAKLLLSEAPNAEASPVPSRHALTIGQELRNTFARFICTSKLVEYLSSMPDGVTAKLRTFSLSRKSDMVTIASAAGVDELARFDDVPAILSESSPHNWTNDGVIIADDKISLPSKVKWDEFKEHLSQLGHWPLEDGNQRSVTLILKSSTKLPRIFSIYDKGNEPPFLMEYELLFSDTASNRRMSETSVGLQSKRVGIVGLGSVGSKIAVSLARSGVRNFELVDDDYLFPENLVRNELSWNNVGFSKVDEIANAIELVAPNAKVVARHQQIASQENAQVAAATLDRLRKADIIIDATANPDVFLILAAICQKAGKPLVWGELYAGGIGAMMARSVPKVDAPAALIREALHQHLASKPPAPFKRATGYDAEDDDGLVIANDADVSQLAASMSRYVLDVLENGMDLEHDYPIYLMGYKRAWFFSSPFDTEPVAVQWSENSLPVAALSEAETESRNKFLRELLTNADLIGTPEPN